MFCQQCGNQLKDGVAFCTHCGANQKPIQSPVLTVEENDERTVCVFTSASHRTPPAQAPATQQNTYSSNAGKTHNDSVSFGQAISLFFKNYTNFSGRASKSEYWWAFLFNYIISLVASLLSRVIYPLGVLIFIATLIPGISLSVRRLHDVGKPGSWWFMGLIPFAGGIILLIQFLKDSDGDNQYGAGPASSAKQYTVTPVNKAFAQRTMTDSDILALAQKHEPVNLDAPDAKHVMDSALGSIIPTYTGIENLAGAMMLCDTQSIAANIAATDTDTLIVIFKALGYHIDQGADVNILAAVQQNVLATLKARF